MLFQNKLIPIVKTSTKTVNINLTRSKKPSEKIELKEQKRKAVLQSIQQQIKSYDKFEELPIPKSKKIKIVDDLYTDNPYHFVDKVMEGQEQLTEEEKHDPVNYEVEMYNDYQCSSEAAKVVLDNLIDRDIQTAKTALDKATKKFEKQNKTEKNLQHKSKQWLTLC